MAVGKHRTTTAPPRAGIVHVHTGTGYPYPCVPPYQGRGDGDCRKAAAGDWRLATPQSTTETFGPDWPWPRLHLSTPTRAGVKRCAVTSCDAGPSGSS